MQSTIHKTDGIVIRTVKYGETSIIATIFTELFGVQTYMVNGVRSTTKKGATKVMYFQPGALLDMVAYHNELKPIQRLAEYKWAMVYRHIFTDVIKNGVAQYMVELLAKCLKQPEANPDLFGFVTDTFTALDAAQPQAMANLPLFFAAHLSHFFGFTPQLPDGEILTHTDLVFDLQEGIFATHLPLHNFYLTDKFATPLAEILMARQPEELATIKITHAQRTAILDALETYYSLHLQDFGRLRTLPVLREIMR